ncbi:MAG TPA: hypothetical protein EYH05_21180, partial [Anaerolineae bacterium]|nr:hypothetical protein [Anaerolineae bacterium]
MPNLQSPTANLQSRRNCLPATFQRHNRAAKGVALSHTAVLNQLASYSDAIQLSQEDVVVSWLPLYHDMG